LTGGFGPTQGHQDDVIADLPPASIQGCIVHRLDYLDRVGGVVVGEHLRDALVA
jgi:hypothetical protein